MGNEEKEKDEWNEDELDKYIPKKDIYEKVRDLKIKIFLINFI